jgi:hypothetical protein
MGSRRRPTLSTYGVSCSVTATELTQLRKRGLTQTDVACPSVCLLSTSVTRGGGSERSNAAYFVHDTSYAAAFLIRNIPLLTGLDVLSYWTFSDIFEESWLAGCVANRPLRFAAAEDGSRFCYDRPRGRLGSGLSLRIIVTID